MTTNIITHNNKGLLITASLTIWFLVILTLSLNHFFITERGVAPINLLITGGLTFSIFLLAYWRLKQFREYVLNIDMRFLVMLHSWRMLGFGFIMLYYVGELPALFAFLAGLGDALVAVVAVFLSYAMFTNSSGVSKKSVKRWNTFGLIDFIIAVSIGILTRTDAILVNSNGINSDLMTQLPFILVPAFLVQFFTITHIIIYLQLRNNYKDKDTLQF